MCVYIYICTHTISFSFVCFVTEPTSGKPRQSGCGVLTLWGGDGRGSDTIVRHLFLLARPTSGETRTGCISDAQDTSSFLLS